MSLSKNSRVIVGVIILGVLACSSPGLVAQDDNDHGVKHPDSNLDRRLARMLDQAGFTGRVESTLERRLGRPINPNSPILDGYSGSMCWVAFIMTIPAAGATLQATEWATLSPSQLAFKTTILWGRTGAVPATRGVHHPPQTRPSIPA